MKEIRRFVSFLLALVMVIGMVPPMAVSAEETEPTQAVTEAVLETTVPTKSTPEETTAPTEAATEVTEETTAPTEAATEATETATIPAETAAAVTEAPAAEVIPAPVLTYRVLTATEEGWTLREWDETANDGLYGEDNLTFSPGEYWLAFYLNTWDPKSEEWDYSPVHVTFGEYLSGELLADGAYNFQENALDFGYYYRVTVSEEGMDKITNIIYDHEEKELAVEIEIVFGRVALEVEVESTCSTEENMISETTEEKTVVETTESTKAIAKALPSGSGTITNCNDVSGSEFSNNTEIAQKLDKMFAGDIGLYHDSACTNLVNAALGTYSVPPDAVKHWNKGWYSGESCYAYANAFYGKFYDGAHPTHNVTSNHEIITAGGTITYDNFVRWGVRDDAAVYVWVGSHAVIVLHYDSQYITTIDGNGDGHGLVAIRKQPWSYVSGYRNFFTAAVTRIVQPTKKYFSQGLMGNSEGGYLSKCKEFLPSYGKIKISKTPTNVKTLPCSATTNSESKTLESPKIGDEYTVYQLIFNDQNRYWYKIKSKQTGDFAYIFAGDTTWLGQITDDPEEVTVTGVKAPTTLEKGKIFYLDGKIQSKYNGLHTVAALVYPGSATVGNHSTGTAIQLPVSTYSYSIAKSDLDDAVSFGTLPVGDYTYTIKAGIVSYVSDDGLTKEQLTPYLKLLHKSQFSVVNGHVCQKGKYLWKWDAHPHYSCYACSICGDEMAAYDEPNYSSSCTTCNPPAPTYTITLNPSNGSCSVSTITVTEGVAIGTLPVPTRSGYIFEGWYTSGGTQITSSSTFTGNTTIYAVWNTDYVNIGEDFYAYLSNKSSGLGVSNINGNVQLGTAKVAASTWRFVLQSDGSYKILSALDNCAMDVYNNETEDFTNVWVYGENDTLAQRWFIRSVNGGYLLISANSGKALDVDDGNLTSGTNLQIYTINNTAAQIMSITKTPNPTISSSATSITLDVGESTTIWITKNGYYAEDWTFGSLPSNYNVGTAWGDWDGPSCSFTITGLTPGTTSISFSLLDYDTDEILDEITVNVTVKSDDYTVTFDPGNGDSVTKTMVKPGGTIKVTSQIPYRLGYTFLGWGFSDGAVQLHPGEQFTVGSNLAFYAIWEKGAEIGYDTNWLGFKKTVIPYYPNADYFYTFTPGVTTSYSFCIGAPSSTFLGTVLVQDEGGELLAHSTSVTEGNSCNTSCILTAGKTYYIAFVSNGEEMPVRISRGYKVDYDANKGVNAPTSTYSYFFEGMTISSMIPTRAGYSFLGWSTDKNATSAEYYPNDEVGFQADTTLYAVWERINETSYGDLNGDRNIDSLDAVYLLWHSLYPSFYPVNTHADFNGSGAVDGADAEYLLWHTLFPGLYPLQ